MLAVTVIAQILLGMAVLLLGRQLFWIFVGAVGFSLGLFVSSILFTQGAEWMQLLIGVLVGAVFAVLSILIQKPMAAIAAFFAGGLFDMLIFRLVGSGLGADSHIGWVSWVLFLIGGIVSAIVILIIFDWALIALSSMIGASMIMSAIGRLGNLSPLIGIVIFVALVATGMWVQSKFMQRTESAETEASRA